MRWWRGLGLVRLPCRQRMASELRKTDRESRDRDRQDTQDQYGSRYARSRRCAAEQSRLGSSTPANAGRDCRKPRPYLLALLLSRSIFRMACEITDRFFRAPRPNSSLVSLHRKQGKLPCCDNGRLPNGIPVKTASGRRSLKRI